MRWDYAPNRLEHLIRTGQRVDDLPAVRLSIGQLSVTCTYALVEAKRLILKPSGAVLISPACQIHSEQMRLHIHAL